MCLIITLVNFELYIILVLTGLITVYFTFINWTNLRRIFKTLPRDTKIIKDFITYFAKIRILKLRGYDTYAKIFKTLVIKHPNKIAFKHEDSTWTFQEVENYSNKIANYFKEKGFKRGDSVALFMESCPEYVSIWLGLSKIGVVVALINSNLQYETLLHSIKVSNCKTIITDTGHIDTLSNILTDKNNGLFSSKRIYLKTGRIINSIKYINLVQVVILDKELADVSTKSPEDDIHLGSSNDEMLYIYTSGTTGLPKAAIMTQSRAIYIAMGTKHVAGINENDILYTPLPLYHTAGGILGVGSVLLGGSTCVIKSKFSASNYWKDCIKYKCTIAQYIGEMCRYCLSVPTSEFDTSHQVRMIIGNGLRPQIWQEFVQRFNIQKIVEFYGATEGNANMMNATNKIGAVGFIPIIAQLFYPITLIKVDPVTNEPLRGSNNLCIECEIGEPGLLIGKIKNTTENSFTGYVEKTATNKKIIKDVFQKDDKFFNTGDVLVRDELNFYYFKDRTGDTFRWKGENVSTNEVEAVISSIIAQKDCIVYGVEIPYTEGKAGMAAIFDKNGEIDLNDLIIGINKSLPNYARPLFLRIIKESISLTEKISQDCIYFNEGNKFIPFTQELYKKIKSGKIRV
ncbi:long-chain fatty acid transport protein 4-like isoform X2 [Daktulosphaira vitifoliae]|uniref:long-chain fatty acid transport protein 4-like isoform X2 n=1 Tax=Daktulosphaira vitifoliae TaxID=58002 RepID=UPI0021AA74A7|nr:long-chain fatty acid transport protein 4-like isoform X2 [Daktulosphaira vitifoliae]